MVTAEDVGVFPRALNDGSLLTAEEQAIYSSIYDCGHEGWLPGYQSIARYHPELDAVVIQLVSPTCGDRGGSKWHLIRLLLQMPVCGCSIESAA